MEPLLLFIAFIKCYSMLSVCSFAKTTVHSPLSVQIFIADKMSINENRNEDILTSK